MVHAETQTLFWLREASQSDINRAVEALYHVHGLMAALTDLDSLLERISEEGRAVARAEAASVMLYDEATDELYFRVALGDSGDQEALKREVRLRPGQGIAGAAALDRETIHVEDVDKDPRFFRDADERTRFRTRNILAIPMIERNKLVGVLELLNKEDNAAFSPLDRHVMEMFSSVAASAVVNARLIERQIKTERLAAIGQAIAGLTHHIKNILTGLNTSADLIEMALGAGDVAIVKKTWPILRRGTQRISNFVQDLLLFAKPREPLLRQCNLMKLVAEVCETMRDALDQKKIALEIEGVSEVGAIMADPDMLFRCLLNLLGNAADAAPPQEGRIVVSATRTQNRWIEIVVTDNGPGIPAEMQEQVFEIFFSTKGARGTGLGLAGAAKIAREHKGDLVLLNHSGGASFQLKLPAEIDAS